MLTEQNLVRLTRPESPRARLVCFPQAGAGSGAFGRWRKQVRDDVELVALRLPGRESLFGQPLVADLRVIGRSLGDILARDDRALPTGLFGYCAGAYAALEVARRMTERRRPPSVLAVCSQVAPQVPATMAPIHARPAPELREILRSLGGTDPVVLDRDEVWITVEPALRADYQALETYSAGLERRLGCELAAFHGSDDDQLELPDVAAWSELTTGPFTMTRVPGGHFLLKAGAAEVLAWLQHRLRHGPAGATVTLE